jgi:DNA-binding protein YbaB
MSEQHHTGDIEEIAALRFSGIDDRGVVTLTTDGAGKVVGVRIEPESVRRLPAQIFESSVAQALSKARGAAAAADRSAMSILRDQGIDLDAARRDLP